MIEYFDERPDMHHEIGALDYMRFTGAPYLASIHSKLKSHKDDDRCHITDEERDKWNRKVDKSTFYELENKEWVDISGIVKVSYDTETKKTLPICRVTSVKRIEEPENDIINLVG